MTTFRAAVHAAKTYAGREEVVNAAVGPSGFMDQWFGLGEVLGKGSEWAGATGLLSRRGQPAHHEPDG